MSLHSQIHKEVVHHRFVHQRHTGDTKEELKRFGTAKLLIYICDKSGDDARALIFMEVGARGHKESLGPF